MAPAGTDTDWTVGFDTLRRERLFRHPPKDRSAYPSLDAAIRPHIDSFNALFGENRIIDQGLKDIGIKTFLDGDQETAEQRKARKAEGRRAPRRNRLNVRVREVFLEKAVLPPSNKFSARNREIYPSECRERHATYRGRLRARLEYQVNNGDWKESIRELGQIPLMLRVSGSLCQLSALKMIDTKE
jgi:DNA-directed RNA polymerase I subunit RPA2